MPAPKVISIDGVNYVREDSLSQPKAAGPDVIVRTRDAGVHIGVLKARSGTDVTLTNARRLWSWAGAFTLNEVSQNGVSRKQSRISAAVPEITILSVCEIIPVAAGVDLSPTEK